jgi:acyl-CoA hydrolase
MKASDEDVSVVSELVFPGQENHHGTLFGGETLKLMTKSAYIAAARAVRKPVVLAAVERTTFHQPVERHALAEILARVAERGTRSLTVEAELYSENLLTGERRLCVTGRFVMVTVERGGITEGP